MYKMYKLIPRFYRRAFSRYVGGGVSEWLTWWEWGGKTFLMRMRACSR